MPRPPKNKAVPEPVVPLAVPPSIPIAAPPAALTFKAPPVIDVDQFIRVRDSVSFNDAIPPCLHISIITSNPRWKAIARVRCTPAFPGCPQLQWTGPRIWKAESLWLGSITTTRFKKLVSATDLATRKVLRVFERVHAS